MLLAKLTEPVEKIYQKAGLETEVVTAQYLAASVNDYTMGVVQQTFYYKIGKVEFDDEQNPISFQPVIRGYVELTEEEFSSWGTDDFVALQAIATKLGLQVEEQLKINGAELGS